MNNQGIPLPNGVKSVFCRFTQVYLCICCKFEWTQISFVSNYILLSIKTKNKCEQNFRKLQTFATIELIKGGLLYLVPKINILVVLLCFIRQLILYPPNYLARISTNLKLCFADAIKRVKLFKFDKMEVHDFEILLIDVTFYH